MDAREQKLAAKLKDAPLAETLVAAGYDTPGAIRDASDGELRNVVGLDQKDVDALRARFPQRKQA